MWQYLPDAIPKEIATHVAAELFEYMKYVESPQKTTDSQPKFGFFSHPAGLSYKYFKTTVVGREFPPVLSALKKVAEIITGGEYEYNVAFVNVYDDGTKQIPYHRDKSHSKDGPIISFSLYANGDQTNKCELRTLTIKDDESGNETEILMENRSAVIMEIGMQEKYQHKVPPSETARGWRLNVTLRTQLV